VTGLDVSISSKWESVVSSVVLLSGLYVRTVFVRDRSRRCASQYVTVCDRTSCAYYLQAG